MITDSVKYSYLNQCQTRPKHTFSLGPCISTAENVQFKDNSYDNITRRLQGQVKKRPKKKRTIDNPMGLKGEVKGKHYTYCKSKGWSGRGHVEEYCQTKKRDEKQKAEGNKTENNKQKQEEEVLISVVRIKGARGLKREYQYNRRQHTIP